MTPNVLIKFQDWKKRNKLNQKQYRSLLEAFRRIHTFKNGNFKANRVLLAVPSTVDLEYFTPYKREVVGIWNWYNLNSKGVKVLIDLDVIWESDLNEYIFNSV